MDRIACYRSPKIETKESKIDGKGIFARQNIAKGEMLFIKAGHIVGYDEAMKCSREIGEYDVQISDNFFLVPKRKDEIRDLAVQFNHSCNPNAGPDGQITFVALRDIIKGQEITCDYAAITAYPYRLSCKCGSKNCRKIITGDDWRSEELQKRYGNNFSWFILKKIRGL
ncbi:MAG: SET domain-containing protein-lysine N-methyltransferase [archaeon]